jgi:hypothetical protein
VFFTTLKLTDILKETHEQTGNFPRAALTLHFHFAKLFVCSHVFRGLTSDATADPIPKPFTDIAMTALESAKSIADLIIEDPDLRAAFVSVPHYYHTMIAFACSFLLKMATKYREQITVDTQKIFAMIGRVVELCKMSQCTRYHLVHWMGEGLQVLLSNCVRATSERSQHLHRGSQPNVAPETASEGFDSSNQHQSQGQIQTPESTQSLGNAWDMAREAAILYPNDRSTALYGNSNGTNGNGESMEGINTVGIDLEDFDYSMNMPMTNFSTEHMGFRLL